ncbi:MAG: PepSY domain-containing protein [Pyrinomonadaceae bacterium]
MNKKIIAGAILSAALTLGGAGGAVFAKPKKPKVSKPVTIEQAQAIALKKVPGSVENSKTDTLKGKTAYMFEISRTKGGLTDVWVNSEGKVVKTQKVKTPKTEKPSNKMKKTKKMKEEDSDGK